MVYCIISIYTRVHILLLKLSAFRGILNDNQILAARITLPFYAYGALAAAFCCGPGQTRHDSAAVRTGLIRH